MRKLLPLLFFEVVILLVLIPIFSLDPGRSVSAQTSYPDPDRRTRLSEPNGSRRRRPSDSGFRRSGNRRIQPQSKFVPAPTGSCSNALEPVGIYRQGR